MTRRTKTLHVTSAKRRGTTTQGNAQARTTRKNLMICQEVMMDEIEAEKAAEVHGWNFIGVAAMITLDHNKQDSNDLSSDNSSTASMPRSLVVQYHEDSSNVESSCPSLSE